MFSEQEIREIVNNKICQDEDLGEQVGGSGHLGYKSYRIDQVNKPEKIESDNEELWRIIYEYTVYVETEFTFYPDNPPHEYKYRKSLFLDNNGKLLES
ncbi:MAG: hypothetical protein ACFFC6_12750 [Promethearchaeota archaeon]